MRALALLLALATLPAAAQTQQVLFPGQKGTELLSSLRTAYRPASLPNYSGSQDFLMDVVDRTTVNGVDGVVCVYTGWFVELDNVPANNPNQDVFNGGSGLNTEHTWPQSRLTGDPGPRSDMHHLFPTQVEANSRRGNLGFGEIPDNQTSIWLRGYRPYNQSSIPTSNIDEYSELLTNQRFEPREDHKGNTARALFYMSAIWDGQVTQSYFTQAQQDDLYDWHYADPITAEDQARSARVAQFQSGKDNPFVLDSTLVRRAFFPEIIIVADEDAPTASAPTLRLDGAHPFRDAGRLTLSVPTSTPVRAELIDALGRRVAVLHDGTASAGTLTLRIDGARLAPGVYHAVVRTDGAVLTQRVVRLR